MIGILLFEVHIFFLADFQMKIFESLLISPQPNRTVGQNQLSQGTRDWPLSSLKSLFSSFGLIIFYLYQNVGYSFFFFALISDYNTQITNHVNEQKERMEMKKYESIYQSKFEWKICYQTTNQL